MARRIGWRPMGTHVCRGCGLSIHRSWGSRHDAAGCDARVGLSKDNQFNDARIILGDYIRATGSHSRIELEEYLLANFPEGDAWEANVWHAAGVVKGFMNEGRHIVDQR